MTDPEGGELDRLLAEIEALDEEYWSIMSRWTHWGLSVGPVSVSGYFGSQTIALTYASFCVTCFVAGGVLAVFSTTKELGVALVVGSIFAGGAFVAQWWAVQVGIERQVDAEVLGSRHTRQLRALVRRRDKLVAWIERAQPGYFDQER
jgi:hypothetical protein